MLAPEITFGSGMYHLISDIRRALRTARRYPLAVSVAVLSVAVCTGPSTALFSVARAVFIRPMPIEKPNQIVDIYLRHGTQYKGWSYPNYLDVARRSHAFSGIIGWDRRATVVTVPGTGETEVSPFALYPETTSACWA